MNHSFNKKKILKIFGATVAGIALILGVLALLISLLAISRSQKVSEEIFKEEIIMISDFTLHFQNMNFESKKITVDLENFFYHLVDVYKIEIDKKYQKVKRNEDRIEKNEVLKELERLEYLIKNPFNILYDINYTFVDQIGISIILEKNSISSKRKNFNVSVWSLTSFIELNIRYYSGFISLLFKFYFNIKY